MLPSPVASAMGKTGPGCKLPGMSCSRSFAPLHPFASANCGEWLAQEYVLSYLQGFDCSTRWIPHYSLCTQKISCCLQAPHFTCGCPDQSLWMTTMVHPCSLAPGAIFTSGSSAYGGCLSTCATGVLNIQSEVFQNVQNDTSKTVLDVHSALSITDALNGQVPIFGGSNLPPMFVEPFSIAASVWKIGGRERSRRPTVRIMAGIMVDIR